MKNPTNAVPVKSNQAMVDQLVLEPLLAAVYSGIIALKNAVKVESKTVAGGAFIGVHRGTYDNGITLGELIEQVFDLDWTVVYLESFKFQRNFGDLEVDDVKNMASDYTADSKNAAKKLIKQIEKDNLAKERFFSGLEKKVESLQKAIESGNEARIVKILISLRRNKLAAGDMTVNAGVLLASAKAVVKLMKVKGNKKKFPELKAHAKNINAAIRAFKTQRYFFNPLNNNPWLVPVWKSTPNKNNVYVGPIYPTIVASQILALSDRVA